MKLGRNLAKTFLDYYKLTSLITPKPTASTSLQVGFRWRLFVRYGKDVRVWWWVWLVGCNLAKTFLDYYKLTSLIAPKPTASMSVQVCFKWRLFVRYGKSVVVGVVGGA